MAEVLETNSESPSSEVINLDQMKDIDAENETNETKKRERHIQNEAQNPEQNKRSKRLFSVLLGTLNKFKEDTAVKTEAELNREKLEEKMREKLKKEKEELREKFNKEQEEKKEKLRLEREAEDKSRMEEIENIHQTNLKFKKNFLKTKTLPLIYFSPYKLNEKHQELKDLQEKEEAELKGEDATESSTVNENNAKTDVGEKNVEDDDMKDEENSVSSSRGNKDEDNDADKMNLD
ncbi:hypothetical protein HDU92_005618 [Lobulomyces angularis]|nr:hypothetical protein HDU92_005618 [Lobulomyces angularis]